MKEVWKDIKGYKDYEISNESLIRRITEGNSNCTHKGKILKHSLRGFYKTVTLYKKDERHLKKVHRLVAQAFIANPENKPEINHIDGDKLNNHYLNLEWSTRKENMQHAEYVLKIYKPKGEKHGNSKFKNEDIFKIRKSYPDKNMIVLAKIYNVYPSTIEAIINRKTWKHI